MPNFDFADFFDDFNKKKIFFLLSILVAIFVFFRLLPSQNWELSTLLDGVRISDASAIDSTTEGTVIIDKSNTRLLFLNRKNELSAQVNAGDLESPFERFYDVAVSSDGVYITGASFISGGTDVLKEGLALYSHDGTFRRMIASDDYAEQASSVPFPSPRYQRIVLAKDKLILYKLGIPHAEIQQIFPAEGFRQLTFDVMGTFTKVFPLPEEGKHLLCDNTGLLYLYEVNTSSLDRIDYIPACDFILQSIKPPSEAWELVFADCLIPYGQRFSHYANECDRFYHINWKGELYLYSSLDNADNRISSVPLTTSLFAKQLLFWISSIYLGLLTLLLLYLLGCQVMRFPPLRIKALQLLFVILLSAGISFFYTDITFDIIKEYHLENARTELQQLHFNIESFYGPTFRHIETQGLYNYFADSSNREEMNSLISYIHKISALSEQHDGAYIELSLMDDYGRLYSLADSSHLKNIGDITDTIENLWEEGDVENDIYPNSLNSNIFNGIYRFIRNDDGNKIIGMLDVGFFESALLYDQLKFAIKSFVSLFAAFMALYVAFITCRLVISNIAAYKQKKRQQKPLACTELFPTITFLFSQIIHIDIIVKIFIIQKLLSDAAPAVIVFWLAAFPAAYFLGTLSGSSLLPGLQKRMTVRQLGLSFGAGSALSFLSIILSLYGENIWLYVLSVFFNGLIANGILFNWFSLIPLTFKEEDRSAVMYANRRAYDLSSIIVFPLTAYVYEYFDYPGLYGLAMIICLVIFAIMFFSFEKSYPQQNLGTEKDSVAPSQGGWRFFLLPIGFGSIFFVILPQVIAGNYANFFFPIVAAAGGLSAVIISNICVCARVFSMVVRNNIIAIKTKLAPKGTLITGLFIFGWAYAMFFANVTMVWAAIALFVITAFYDCTDTTYFVISKAEEYGYNPMLTGPILLIVDSVAKTIAPFILSGGINYLGSRYCCTAIGLFTILSALIIWRLTETKGEKVPAEA